MTILSLPSSINNYREQIMIHQINLFAQFGQIIYSHKIWGVGPAPGELYLTQIVSIKIV